MKTQPVSLGERSYPIHIGGALLDRAGELLADAVGRRAVIVTNATVAAYHLASLRTGLATRGVASDVVMVPDGEAHKSWSTLEDIVTRLLELRVDRATTVIALGGGVIGDLAGFAAAIALRGLPFVQIPTTLLAQVDSSVGGKTGINHPLGKNLIGAFWQPSAVLCDIEVLSTLPPPEYASGLGEMAKYAFLGVEGLRDLPLDEAVAACVRCKADVVASDERESGRRALLNYGHTLAHAIETAGGYGLRHSFRVDD